MTVRTRFSPSPTGNIHLGNARAAIFSALYAAKHDGVFILRIEDTDAERSEEKYIEGLQDDLHWLGIDWQEGPGVDGKFGPYRQSLRQETYNIYYTVLEKKKLIYPCFCTDQELLLARKRQLSRGLPPRYLGTCKKLTAEDIQKKLDEGRQPAWRFMVPENEIVEFTDIVKGPQHFATQDIGDFIIRRADGTAPFLFCNAVDDATMKVTHVLRGEDHIANTPRQILLLQAMDLSLPQYGHLSLIVGDDGAPLSKRHGSSSVKDIREAGFLPQAIMNYLARLGHVCESQELLDFNHLAEQFVLEKLSRSPARFDTTQLMYWQKTAVQGLDAENMWRWLGESVSGQVPLNMQDLFIKVVKGNIEFPEDALKWAKIFFHDKIDFDEASAAAIRDAGEQFFVEAENAVTRNGTNIKAVLEEMKTTLGLSGKKLFMPLRAALTGRIDGPEMANIAEILGQEKMQHRLSRAFKVVAA
ncbi:MAG TPA: glutamate--tRNA ligase [Gammaproteobacteria bacterium]|nr:glutamate--tRNA ligase [Gammaproteobacteria bacterium]